MADLPTLLRKPASGGPPEQIVVLIHGLGAGGADLIELAPVLAASLPDALFVAPDAPFACDMAPFGRQWFSAQSRDSADMAAGIAKSASIFEPWLAGLLERHRLPGLSLALLGFSQGAMMALHSGLRMRPRPAAIVGFSGRLIVAPGLSDTDPGAPPVLLVHGAKDDVVPKASMTAAEQALRSRDIAVECRLRPDLGHAIDPEGLALAAGFLQRAFGVSP